MYAGSKLVGPEIGYLEILHIIIVGSIASAGSSALNHYYDRDMDSKMKRTSNRPIPSGRSSGFKSSRLWTWGIACSFCYLCSLDNKLWLCAFLCSLRNFLLCYNLYTVWLKRLNSSNIVIGGFAGSAASMAGWSAATGSIDILGFLIGFLVFVWTPSHFWCLAMKLRDDYAEANVPMLPVLIGMERTSKYILANTIILLPYSLLLYAFGMGIVYTVIAVISGGLMLVYHYKLTKTPTSDFAWKAYKVTAPYLTIIFIGIALDAAFHFRF